MPRLGLAIIIVSATWGSELLQLFTYGFMNLHARKRFAKVIFQILIENEKWPCANMVIFIIIVQWRFAVRMFSRTLLAWTHLCKSKVEIWTRITFFKISFDKSSSNNSYFLKATLKFGWKDINAYQALTPSSNPPRPASKGERKFLCLRRELFALFALHTRFASRLRQPGPRRDFFFASIVRHTLEPFRMDEKKKSVVFW